MTEQSDFETRNIISLLLEKRSDVSSFTAHESNKTCIALWMWMVMNAETNCTEEEEEEGKKCHEAWEQERLLQICRNPLETVNCIHFQPTSRILKLWIILLCNPKERRF